MYDSIIIGILEAYLLYYTINISINTTEGYSTPAATGPIYERASASAPRCHGILSAVSFLPHRQFRCLWSVRPWSAARLPLSRGGYWPR